MLDTDGAFLVVGLQRDRVGGVESYLVDELALVEPRDEHDPARHLIASAGFEPSADEAASRLNLHLVTAAHIERSSVVCRTKRVYIAAQDDVYTSGDR